MKNAVRMPKFVFIFWKNVQCFFFQFEGNACQLATGRSEVVVFGCV